MPSRVHGTLRASPSKSHTHRAIVLAGLSTGTCRIRRPLRSEDTDATMQGMAAFGTHFDSSDEELRVEPGALRLPRVPLDARNSGTTLRFLAGVASLLDGVTTLTGGPSLRTRPMGPLLGALDALGASTKSLGGDGRPPIEVRGILRGGEAVLPGDVSSQFASSLLLVCPLVEGPSRLEVRSPTRSRPYIDMTLEMMARFGVHVVAEGDAFEVRGGQAYRPTDIEVPGDYASAAFPFVAAAITDGDVTVTGLPTEGAVGDRGILETLRAFGAPVDQRTDRVTVRGGPLIAQTIDIGDTPDLFPILAVLASQADGETRFVNGGHLRFKESDRIDATVSMLRVLGGRAKATADGCTVSGPSRLLGGSVDSRGDHRILMAAAVAGLVARDAVDISDPECFRDSYPSFLDDMRSLGAIQAVIE